MESVVRFPRAVERSSVLALYRSGRVDVARVNGIRNAIHWTAENLESADEVRGAIERMGGALRIGFSPDSGLVEDATITWLRDHPTEIISVAEFRSVIREAKIRAMETLRRRGWTHEMAELVQSAVLDVRIDGKRVTNPVGFSGRTFVIALTHTFLFTAPGAFLESLRSSNQNRGTLAVFLDDALVRYVAARAAHEGTVCIIVLDAATTTFVAMHGMAMARRRVIAAGYDDAARYVGQTLGLTHAEAQRLLYADATEHLGFTLKRRLAKTLVPYMHTWVQNFQGVFKSVLPGDCSALIAVIAGVAQAPFHTLLSNTMLRKMFSFPRATVVNNTTIFELTSLSPEHDIRDAFAALMAKQEGAQFYV